MSEGPRITRVVFETDGPPDSTPAAKFASQHLARTVGHLEQIDVGAIVTAYLEAHMKDLDPDDSSDLVADEILRLISLVDTVIDEARKVITQRMAIDIAMRLLPRLEGRTR